MAQMRQQWRNLLELEKHRFAVTSARRLWNDILYARQMAIRMMYIFYERDSFSHESRAGSMHLRGLLEVFPDNKNVEDVHNSIRSEVKSSGNARVRLDRVQHCVRDSGVLEARNVKHSAMVDKDTFIREYRRSKARVWGKL